ncbi:MAG: hypothetical protein AB1515_06865 [Nitrospirota bacterium]
MVLLLSLAALTLAGSGLGRAEEPLESPNITIGGFIAYSYTFNDDLADSPFFFSPDNPNERNFDLKSEIDIGVRWDWASARFDLNIPADFNEDTGILNESDEIGIEQARFDLMPPFGKGINLTLTGGVFNAPIGLQHQDPDQRDSITDGLQFGMVPSNLFGLDIAGGNEIIWFGAIIANEWRTDADEQLTFGAHIKWTLTDKFNLSAAGLWSSEAIGDNYVINSVASTAVIPWINLDIEGTVNDKNYAAGTAIRIARPEHPQCGAALRYEKVWASAGSDFTDRFYFSHLALFDLAGTFFTVPDEDHDFDLLSLTLYTEPLRNLKLQTEGRATRAEIDGPGGDEKNYYSLVARATYSF